MRKQCIAMVGAAVLCVSISTAAFAATTAVNYGNGCGICVTGDSLMWDEDGNFLNRESFESALDRLIEDGTICEEDRDYYLERYEWCSTYGGGAVGIHSGYAGTRRGASGISGRAAGTRGGGCGMGRGR